MRVVEKAEEKISPWVTLVANTIETTKGKLETYHSIGQADYVGILAITIDGKIPLIEQYRLACNTTTLELPGGLLEKDEVPANCAVRELIEEVGLKADPSKLILLGKLKPDTGRLENNLWAFFVNNAEYTNAWETEPGIQKKMVDPNMLVQLINDNRTILKYR